MGSCEKHTVTKCHGAIIVNNAVGFEGVSVGFGAGVQRCACSAVTGRGGCKAVSRCLTGCLLLKNPVIAKINPGT